MKQFTPAENARAGPVGRLEGRSRFGCLPVRGRPAYEHTRSLKTKTAAPRAVSMFSVPVVTEADFEALKTIMSPPVPETYEDWLALCSKWRSEHSADGVVQFPVNPREFAEFMSGAGRTLDVQALLEYAAFNPWHDPD